MFETLKEKLSGIVSAVAGFGSKKKKKKPGEGEGQPDAVHLPSRIDQIAKRRKEQREYLED